MRRRWDILLVIAAGGALGSVARWALAEAFPHDADGVPWGTFVANVSGALLLGVLMVLVLDVWPTTRLLRPFLGVGVLGGYTTFSAYMLEVRAALAGGHWATGTGYLLGTVVAGLVAVWAGVLAARATVARGRGRGRGREARS